MKYIHSNGIIISNLKSYNIIIGSDGLIKISDIKINRIKAIENIKSLYLIAPKVLKNAYTNEKVDVYTFGIRYYFISKVSLVELANVKSLQVPSSFPPNAKEIIEYCCSIDPQIRLGFIEIVDYFIKSTKK